MQWKCTAMLVAAAVPRPILWVTVNIGGPLSEGRKLDEGKQESAGQVAGPAQLDADKGTYRNTPWSCPESVDR